MKLDKESIGQKVRFSVVGVLVSSVSAVAQTDSLGMKAHQLEGVTITAAQRRHTLTSTSPLQQLDRRDLLTMGIADIADALRRLPGITLRDYGGAGGMKTVSVRGFGAKHTGVSYDGIMLSECQSGEIDLSRYSIDNVDHLSLVIGDNADIFVPARQASMPATLNIQTLRMPTADRRPHLQAQLKTGSFGYVSPFVRYEHPLSHRWSLTAVGHYTYADNDYPYTVQNVTETVSDRRTNSRMKSGHGELNLVCRPTPQSQLSAKLYYYDNSRQLPGQVHYYTTLSRETLREQNAFGQLSYQSRLGEHLSVKAHGKWNWAASHYRDALYQGGINDASYWQREGYASVAMLYTPAQQWAVSYSADYAYNNLNGSSMRSVVGRPFRHTVLQTIAGRYHGERLTLQGRLLHSLYMNSSTEGPSARNMRRLSPSLSLSYKLLADAELYLRASYKNIFRSPTFNESYYFHYGSTDLLPETTHQWNLGATYATPRERTTELTLTLDGYYNRVQDMIVAVPQNMFVWTCVNVGRVRVVGLDATLRASRLIGSRHRLTASGNYSYQRVEDVTDSQSAYYGNQIAYLPEHSLSASVSYENPWVNMSLHMMGMSDRWANNSHYAGTSISGFTDCGLTLWRTFALGRHRLEGRLDLRNLFDKQYEIVYRYPMPGRDFQLSVSWKI